jgi:serine/threonine protein kinase
MTPEELSRIRGIYEQALSMSASVRDAFLRGACQEREDVRVEVEKLLHAHDNIPTWMERPVLGAAGALQPPRAPGLEGRNIGGYTLVREIGRGGMGVVYLAERSDDTFRRQVAVKLLLPAAGSDDIIARFQQERRILASLEHPHIAKLLDAGATEEGWPYFVMEFVEGQPIDRWCDERKLNISQRIELFRSVIDAVEYAHRHLVVHRDLKPGNIFVTGDGVVKLLDFGIAKVISDPLNGEAETLTLAHMMTLGYASPEQVNGSVITTQSDVYSLGVVLYELLTGHKPYRLASAAAHEISRVIADVEPARPSDVVTQSESASARDRVEITPEYVSATREGDPNRLRKRLAGDLDAIVMMALRKEPERRYGSVASLADDLQRHLEQRTIRAREASLWERFGRFRHRNFGGFALGGVVVLLIFFGVTSVVVQLRHDIEAAERNPRLDTFPLPFWLFGLGLGICAFGSSVAFARISGAMPRISAPGGKPLRFAGMAGGLIWAAASTLTWSIGRSHGWWSSRISGQPDPLWLLKPPDFGTCVAFGGAALWTLYMTGRRLGRLAQLAGLVLLGLGKAMADRLLFGKVIPALTFAPGAVPFWFSAAVAAAAAWIGLCVMHLAARRDLPRVQKKA